MNKFFAMLAVLSALGGCRTAPEQAALDTEREHTRRFAICMKQSLGPFGTFAAPSVRQQAAENCTKVITAAK